MKVSLVSISQCTSDMVVASDIIDESDNIIVKADTPISFEILQKLHKFNIEELYTYKSFLSLLDEPKISEKQKDYDDMKRSLKSIFNDIALGKRIRFTELESLTDGILSDIISNLYLIFSLQGHYGTKANLLPFLSDLPCTL